MNKITVTPRYRDSETLQRFAERYLRVELPGADDGQIQAAAEAFIAGLGDEFDETADHPRR